LGARICLNVSENKDANPSMSKLRGTVGDADFIWCDPNYRTVDFCIHNEVKQQIVGPGILVIGCLNRRSKMQLGYKAGLDRTVTVSWWYKKTGQGLFKPFRLTPSMLADERVDKSWHAASDNPTSRPTKRRLSNNPKLSLCLRTCEVLTYLYPGYISAYLSRSLGFRGCRQIMRESNAAIEPAHNRIDLLTELVHQYKFVSHTSLPS
ncbi:hypothetical protein KCU76_g15, partial [Aureobasidium melanogenum]